MTTDKDDWNSIYSNLNDASGNPALEWRWVELIKLLNLDSYGNDLRLIDFGCGDAALLRRLRPLYPKAQFAGLDGADSGISRARTLLPDCHFASVDFNKATDAGRELLPFVGNVAICTEVLEHLDDPVTALSTCKKFLEKGAKLVITVPAGPMSASDRYFGHRKHYTVALLREELRAAQFEVVDIWAAGFPFQNLYRLLVLLRGQAAINDQIGTQSASFSVLSRLAFFTFRILFRANLFWPPLGWQIFAVGRA